MVLDVTVAPDESVTVRVMAIPEVSADVNVYVGFAAVENWLPASFQL